MTTTRLRRGIWVLVTGLLAAATATVTAPAPASAHHLQAIWIGSPVQGTWGVSGDASTTPAGGHHRLYKATPQNDWAVDLSRIPSDSRSVYVYAAPSNSAYNNNVTAKILDIVDENACRYGGGADFVTVGFYFNGALYGRATYAHIDRDASLWEGKTIPRWGTKIGNVAWSASGGPACWTGPHVHLELRAESHYACWNRGYTYAGYPIGRTNFVGFVSGPLGTSSAPCP